MFFFHGRRKIRKVLRNKRVTTKQTISDGTSWSLRKIREMSAVGDEHVLFQGQSFIDILIYLNGWISIVRFIKKLHDNINCFTEHKKKSITLM